MQQVGHDGFINVGQQAFKQFFFRPPDAVFAQCHGHGSAGGNGVFDAFHGANVFTQGPMHQHF